MKHDNNIEYQQNRNSRNIVYCYVDRLHEITLEMFLSENPKATQADYQKWKRFSDALHLEEKRANWLQTHKNLPLLTEDCEIVRVESAEDAYFTSIEEDEALAKKKEQHRLLKSALQQIGKKHRRRFLLHVAHGLTFRSIAEIEGVSHQAIHRSVTHARKKIEQYIKSHDR